MKLNHTAAPLLILLIWILALQIQTTWLLLKFLLLKLYLKNLYPYITPEECHLILMHIRPSNRLLIMITILPVKPAIILLLWSGNRKRTNSCVSHIQRMQYYSAEIPFPVACFLCYIWINFFNALIVASYMMHIKWNLTKLLLIPH